MSAQTWNVVGSLLAFLGTLSGLAGSLAMARTYFAMPVTEFLTEVPRYFVLSLLGKRSELTESAILAEVNRESRVNTLIGLCQLVMGFFLQLIAIICLYLGTLPDRTGG